MVHVSTLQMSMAMLSRCVYIEIQWKNEIISRFGALYLYLILGFVFVMCLICICQSMNKNYSFLYFYRTCNFPTCQINSEIQSKRVSRGNVSHAGSSTAYSEIQFSQNVTHAKKIFEEKNFKFFFLETN